MNGHTHRVVGGIVGGAAYLLATKALGLEPTVTGLAVSVGVGVIGSSLHDFVEPAAHPNHRAFFHSIAATGALAVSLRRCWLSTALGADQKALLMVGGLACMSHPCLDALTPKGLPII